MTLAPIHLNSINQNATTRALENICIPCRIFSSASFGYLASRVTGIISPAQGAIFGIASSITSIFLQQLYYSFDWNRSDNLLINTAKLAITIITSSFVGHAALNYIGTSLPIETAIHFFIVTNAISSLAIIIFSTCLISTCVIASSVR